MGGLARQASWITVLTGAGLALGFVNMALLYPRYLTTAEFGLARLVVAISVVAGQIAQLGLEATVIRYFPYFRDTARRHSGLFRSALLIGLGGSVVAMVLLAVLHEQLASWFNDDGDAYRTYGLVVLPLVLSEVMFILFRGFSRALHRSIAPVFSREFLLRLLQTLLILAHMRWALPFAWFLFAYVGTFMLTTLVLIFDLWRAGGIGLTSTHIRIPRRMAKSMMRYALLTLGVGVSGVAAGNVDQVMLAAMLHNGLDNVAYYTVAMFLASIIMVPGRALVLPALPALAVAWRARDLAHIAALHRRSTTLLLVSGAFIFVCLVVNADAIFALVRPEFGVARPVMVLLGVANMVALAGGLGGAIIGSSRSYAFDATTGLLYFALNLLLDYVLILWFGMIGAAWGTLICMATVVGWRTRFLQRRYGFWPFDGPALARAALATLLSGSVLFLPAIGFPWVDLVLRSALVALVFWPLVHWWNIAPDLIAQVRKVTRSIRS